MITRLRQQLAEERGTTVAEVVVAVALMGVIAAVIMSAMTTMTSATTKIEERSWGNVDLRRAVEIVERDLRAANPIVAIPATDPVSHYRTDVSFTVYCGDAGVGDCTSRNEMPIRYRLNGHTLERIVNGRVERVIGPSGPASLPEAKQRGAVVNPSDHPLFRYFDERGDELDTDGVDDPPSTHFHICTVSMQVNLVVVVEAAPSPVTDDLTTNGTLRNYRTREVDGC